MGRNLTYWITLALSSLTTSTHRGGYFSPQEVIDRHNWVAFQNRKTGRSEIPETELPPVCEHLNEFSECEDGAVFTSCQVRKDIQQCKMAAYSDFISTHKGPLKEMAETLVMSENRFMSGRIFKSESLKTRVISLFHLRKAVCWKVLWKCYEGEIPDQLRNSTS